MRSFYEEVGERLVCAQGVVGGFTARVLDPDRVAPVWSGDTIHEDPEDALAEARVMAVPA